MLLPPSAMVPKLDAQLPPAVLLARMLLVTVSGPGSRLELKMAPPSPLRALLPEKVLLVTVAVPFPSLRMAPPPAKVVVGTCVVLELDTLMLPPLAALLPETVLLVTFVVPFEKIAPPEAPTTETALLPEKVQLVTVSVPPLFSMALGVPPAMVTLASARALPLFTANTPLMLPPLMVITPPPSMVVLAPLNPFVLVTVIVAAPPQLK